jgi:hypothetical protein
MQWVFVLFSASVFLGLRGRGTGLPLALPFIILAALGAWYVTFK